MYEKVEVGQLLEHVPVKRLYNLLYCGFEAADPNLFGPVFERLAELGEYKTIQTVIGEEGGFSLASQAIDDVVKCLLNAKDSSQTLYELGQMMQYALTQFSSGKRAREQFSIMRDYRAPRLAIRRVILGYYNRGHRDEGWKHHLTRTELRVQATLLHKNRDIRDEMDKSAMDLAMFLAKTNQNRWASILIAEDKPEFAVRELLQVDAFDPPFSGECDRM